MTLSRVDRDEALAFRAEARGRLAVLRAQLDPDITVSVLVATTRHECGKRGQRFLELREHYAYSSGRRFAFIWTQGKCPSCGTTAMGSAGRLVDPQQRPPSAHAVVTG